MQTQLWRIAIIALFAAACADNSPQQPTALLTSPSLELASLEGAAIPVLPQVSAGAGHSCAVKADHTVVCWGGVVTAPSGTFLQVSANEATCGLRTDRTLSCWPAGGAFTAPAGEFAQVSTGRVHACALDTSGAAVCWGENFYGGATPRAGVYRQVSSGWHFTCALRTDQTLACWGYNVTGRATPPIGTFRHVDAGLEFACAVRTTGEIVCWGFTPELAAGTPPPPAGTFTQVSAGYRHACAIATDGTLACWGMNDNGRATPPAGTFREVSAGFFHTCGVRMNGAVVCWPDNSGTPVFNRAPTVEDGGPYAGAEGGVISFRFSASDPDGDALEFTWDLGDGTTGAGRALPTAHTYADNGVFTATFTANDGKGESRTATTTVTIDNMDPAVGVVTAPSSPQAVGAVVSVGAPFTDPGSADTHTGRIDWGDGTSSPANMEAGTATGTHTYAVPGVYAVTLSVSDDDGGQGEATFQYVVVYDPAAGFVTGGGWIDSPANACASLCGGGAGKASFGFVARYQSGAQTTVGNTEFQFKAGGLQFKSTSYQWLVVAGASAKYKGLGSINGQGSYAFLVTAVDGELRGDGVDAFRIKITDTATGTVIYDNKPGENDDAATALGGGSVVIHR